MEKHELSKCVAQIRNDQLREYVDDILQKVPEYFWKIPTSSTGKHHPQYALGEGGTVRHTRGAVQIAIDLLNNETVRHMFNISDVGRDIIIGALILHDTIKYGFEKGKYSIAGHGPLVEVLAKFDVSKADPNSMRVRMFKAIRSHMGQWNTDYTNPHKEVAPLPANAEEAFVHMCDYLASRKCLEMNFNHAIV